LFVAVGAFVDLVLFDLLPGDGAFVDLNEELLLFDLLIDEGAFVDLNVTSELGLNDEDDFADVTFEV